MIIAFLVGAAIGTVGAIAVGLGIMIHTLMPGFLWSYLPEWLREKL